MLQPSLIHVLNDLLKPENFPDYCPNGLQVEGDGRKVKRLALAVSMTEEVIQQAVHWGADFLLCHHGMIWDKQDSRIIGPYRRKLKLLLESGMAAAAYHLPLDFNMEVGNNIQLANYLGLQDTTGIMLEHGNHKAVMGKWNKSLIELKQSIHSLLNREPLVLNFGKEPIKQVAICSGGAQGYFEEAIQAGADCFITGEASEQNYTQAQEHGVTFIAAGHYQTERFGLMAVGDLISKKHEIKIEFFTTENPI